MKNIEKGKILVRKVIFFILDIYDKWRKIKDKKYMLFTKRNSLDMFYQN